MNWLRHLFTKRAKPLGNVSPRVQKLLVLTRKQADRLHHGYVGTEHLLLALLELREGVAYTALQNLKVDLAALQQALDAASQPGSARRVRPSIPYTPMVRKVFDYGSAEAIAMGQDYLGTEHVLLGLLCVRWGIAPPLLKRQGLTLENTRKAVREALKPGSAEDTSRA